MTRRSLLLTLALVAGAVAFVPSMPVQAQDRGGAALARLRADASGGITVARGHDGRVRFVGAPARSAIDDPAVGSDESAARAARAHLERYGAAFGGDPDSTYAAAPTVKALGGTRVVRFNQHIAGVPVLGGELVVTDGRDGSLRSMAGSVAGSVRVSAATVDAARAGATARALVERGHSHAKLTVTDLGRWIVDPEVARLAVPGGVRTVRRLEVGDGSDIRRMVLVDDHTGAVVVNLNLIEEADRVVCDRNNVRGAETPCTSGFARTETGGPSGVTDVDDAFDLAGATSDFYQQIGGLDLTGLLGIDVSGAKKLASTVRYCTTDLADSCPYDNAFWNGQQMFYGAGFAGADDVVGHEMTHGVVDQFSKLFYWGQSGAINESLADTIGELIDHRRGVDDDSAWDLGEDLGLGALRSMSDPTIHGDPDKMTSANYAADDSDYGDNGGVHTNSGVGNKTAYLISQGGTFNGQTISGIDTGDSTLTRSAKLYVDVIERLPSGADYAELADQLEQSCADLQVAAVMTAANCAAVHEVTLATELRTNPTNALHDQDAPTTCPANTVKRMLFDSETGTPSAKFAANAGWTRESAAGTTNATSGTESWFAEDTGTGTVSSANVHTSPLLLSTPLALPSGQQSYLSFENWYVTDYFGSDFYDGGTVELGVDGAGPANAEGPAWVNGPDHTLASGFGNTGAGRPAYAGDSRGWSVSKLDLTAQAGHTVQPQFTLRTDNQFGFIGWYLDDIQIYTCDRVPGPVTNLTNTGVSQTSTWSPVLQRISWRAPTVNSGAVRAYRIWVNNVYVKTVDADVRSVQLKLDATRLNTIRVRAVGYGSIQSLPEETKTVPSRLSMTLARTGSTLTFHGALRKNYIAFGNQKLWIQIKSGSLWVTIRSAITTSSGAYNDTLKGAVVAPYRVRFAGAPGVTGTLSPWVRK